jgi:glycosyltransferase involved in cell wall biosynthesis
MALHIWQLDPAHLTPYYNLAICEALAQAGHRVRYLTSRYLYDPDLPAPRGCTFDEAYFRSLQAPWLLKVKPLRQALRGLVYPFNHRAVLARLRHERPDVLHIQWSRLPSLDRPFLQAVRRLGIPIVHTIHNVRSSFADARMVARLGEVYKLVDAFVLHAQANQRDFAALYPSLDPRKMAIVPLISPPYGYPIPTGARALARQAYGFDQDDLVLLAFGIIRHYKGLALLLDAFERLPQDVRCRLLIVGRPDSPQDSADLARARAMGGVVVDERFVPTSEVWRVLHAADVAVLPYREATQSAALIQAMDFGLPVIVSAVGALAESLDGNGWVVPKEDVSALVQAITEASQADLAALGERSRQIVQTRHSPQAIAQALSSLYESLMPARS